MRKILLFAWYIRKTGWDEMDDFHLSHLFQCSHNFTECKINLLVDSFDDKNIDMYRDKISTLGNNIQIDLLQNDPKYCEAKVLKEIFLDNIENYSDCLIFFAHNKTGKAGTEESRKLWISHMYKANLDDFSKVEKAFQNSNGISYGTFIKQMLWKPDSNRFQKYSWHYSGTFYWIHVDRFKSYLEEMKVELPEYSGRFYAEAFLGNIYPIEYALGEKLPVVGDCDLYGECEYYLNLMQK